MAGEIDVPVVAVDLFDLSITEVNHTYRLDGDSISVSTPNGTVNVEVDEDGIVSDYPGLAERV